jgi:sulfate permease, SulP family
MTGTSKFKMNNLPRVFINTLFAGLLAGIIAISNTISYGVTIFSGELSQFTSLGIGLALISGLVLTATMALIGSVPATIAFPKATTTPILALLAIQVSTRMPATATPEDVFISVAATLSICTFGIGFFFLIFGGFRLGTWIRYMPYPVNGGFLAGLGWLLVIGGFSVMVELPFEIEFFQQWLAPETIFRWSPGLIFAVTLFLLQRRYNSDVLIPITILVGLGIFYLIASMNGSNTEMLSDRGWLLGPFPVGKIWDPKLLTKFPQANWRLIGGQVLTMLALIPTALISLLFNSSGIELATKREINFNRELTAAGLANMVASFGGGIMGYHSASLSTLPYKMNAQNRLTGLISAATFGVVLFYGAFWLSLIPKLLIGGLLIYLGLTFLVRWVFESYSLLPKTEYAVLLIILGVIITLGLLQGVLVGVLATIVLFALNYSQINIVRSTLSGNNFQSNVERSPKYQAYLRAEGDRLYILKLQGFIFFGTAHDLQVQIEKRTDNENLSPLEFVILDFNYVHGVDSSALNSFALMRNRAEVHGYQILFADVSPIIQHQLEKRSLLIEGDPITQVFPDMDRAVEYCEGKLLNDEKITSVSIPTIRSQWREIFPDSIEIDVFMKYIDEQIVEDNSILIRKGDPPKGLYFIERGQVTVNLELDSGEIARVRTMSSGTVVGEIGAYLGTQATATVVTDSACILYFLSLNSLKKMEADDPLMAAAFHKYMVSFTSQRLVNSSTTIRALLE